MASGIRDKVAILGMGCAKFGEQWDKDAEDLMLEAYQEALDDAQIESSQIDAAWLGVAFDAISIGPSGLAVSLGLRLDNVPVTKVENFCASGTESFRGAVYAVASGACDIALAVGVEKLKDAGYTNVQNLFGSIFEWVNQELPVENSKDEIVKKVHTYNWMWSKWVNKDKTERVW